MKKILLIIAGALIALLSLPKDFKIEHSVVIAKPKSEVFAYLKLMQNYKNWSPMAKLDAEMKTELKGTDGEVGAILTWAGNKEVGSGEQEIVSITENERIDFDLRVEQPNKALSKAYLITEDAEEGKTKVTWGTAGSNPFPMNLVRKLTNGKLHAQFASGLESLKAALESPAAEAQPATEEPAALEGAAQSAESAAEAESAAK
jgi:hypothetical protein